MTNKSTGEFESEQIDKEIAHTVGNLDREIARLKDENAKLEQTNQNIIKSFQDLYNCYIQLYDQITNSNAALTITAGKLSEALVKYKFTIPQQDQQQ